MAESILTSINLAGGSFNVYYDTVLAVMRLNTSNELYCPSGWKAAVIISHERMTANNGGYTASLIYPISVFNLSNSSTVSYYGTYIYQNGNASMHTLLLTISISNTKFTPGATSYNSPNGTIIFVA